MHSHALDLQRFFDWPETPPARDVTAAINAGPIDPGDALSRDALDRLRDPAPLPQETGWCRLADGVGYTAVRTALPGNTPEMWDWWFDWHPRSAERYRVWYPPAHFGTAFDPPLERGEKPFWGATHYPDEDIGTGREQLRIEFLPPSQYGFSDDALDDPRVGTIVGGYVGSVTKRARFAVMTHVFLRDGDGLALRSRFWLGAALRPDLPGPVAGAAARAINRRMIRKRLIPDEAPKQLALHCAAEYTRLGAMLPELYAQFGRSAEPAAQPMKSST
ncbi:MAG: DAPG hydrolase family protein [Solirubrobacterales bacterium]